MKKILPFLAVGILLLSGIGIYAVPEENGIKLKNVVADKLKVNNDSFQDSSDWKIENKEFSVSFSKPVISDRGEYLNVNIKEIDSYFRKAGFPVLPYFTKTLVLPFKAKIISIECEADEFGSIILNKKVMPSSTSVILDGRDHTVEVIENKEVYNSNNPSPENWYGYKVGSGLKEGEHVTYLSIHIYPVRYIPLSDMLKYAKNFKISIQYEEPINPTLFPNEYDLLVIAPLSYTFFLKKFVNHKDNFGLKTKIVSIFNILLKSEGRDKAEKIKYFIKDAIENWGIKYVLLVGGNSWIPARKIFVFTGGYNEGFLSDLYYADIYKEGGVFEDWDSNENSNFGEYNNSGETDYMDLYPDIYLGRLPSRNFIETFFVVRKLVKYEKPSVKDWFNKMVVCAGDSFNDSEWGTDYIEGEITTDKSLEYMEDFTPIHLYASLDTLTIENIIEEFNKGAGFIQLEGHGNYLGWATHPIHEYGTWIGFDVYDIPKLRNMKKLPVVVVGGCHTSELGLKSESFGWRLIKYVFGGAIATTGYTALSWGADDDVNGNGDPDIIEYASGFLNTLFFKKYGMEEIHILGEMFGEAIAEYINECPTEWDGEFLDIWDCKTVTSCILFGDPSMIIGGYNSISDISE